MRSLPRRWLVLLMLAIVAFTARTTDAGHTDLLGHWALDEGTGQIAGDSSGHSLSGQLGSTPSIDSRDPGWVKGRVGTRALRFGQPSIQIDGRDGPYAAVDGAYLEVPDPSGVLRPTDGLTVQLWLKGFYPAGNVVLLSMGDACAGITYAMITVTDLEPAPTQNRLRFFVADQNVFNLGGPVHRSQPAGVEIWDGRWHHVVGTFAPGEIRIYVDGVLVGSAPAPPAIVPHPAADRLYVGEHGPTPFSQACGYGGFQGEIDDVRIWNRALTPTEIAQLANTPDVHSDVGGYWRFNEGQGQVADDESGNVNHGRLGATINADQEDPAWIAGREGEALSFNGATRVEVAESWLLRPNRISVEAWVRAFGSPGTFRYIVAQGAHGCFSASYALYTGSSGGLTFHINGGGGLFISPDIGPGIWDGNWHHVVGVYDGVAVRLYVDGAQIGSGTSAFPREIGYFLGTPPQGTRLYTFHVGAYAGGELDTSLCGRNFHFVGDVDEVRIWRRALEAPEIVNIFLGGGPGSNRAPSANAGPDQSVPIGTTVALDGTASGDPDGNPLAYQWAFVARPAGSTATLSSSTSSRPTFTVDRPGTYVVELVVSDGTLASGPDTVTITTVTSSPVANAGPDQTVAVGSVVTLDGTGSSDVDGEALTFQWAFSVRPAGSTATLSSTTATAPTFTADVEGSYTLSLTVSDGTATSAADTVTITAVIPQPSGVTLDPNGYGGQLCVLTVCTVGGGQPRTYDLLPGTYQLTVPGGLPLAGGEGTFQVRLDGTVVLDTIAARYFTASGRTITAIVAPVTIDFNGYRGTLSFLNVAFMRGPALVVVPLIVGRRYRLTDPVTVHLTQQTSDFSTDLFGASLSLDGTTVSLDAETAQHFTVTGRTLKAIVTPVTVDLNGYLGVVDWHDITHISGGGETHVLIVGRRYQLAAASSLDPVRPETRFSSGSGVSVSLDGTTVTLDAETARSFTVAGLTITAIVANVTYDPNGYLGPVDWHDIKRAAGTRQLIVGRRYVLSDRAGLDLTRNDIFFSGTASAYGTSLSVDGTTLTLDADTSRHFTAAGTTLTARVAPVTVDPNGDPASFCIALVACGPGNGQSFTVPLLIGRRYELDPAGPFALNFDGRCSPTVIPHGGFSVLLRCFNAVPLADAGADQSVSVGAVVTLDGTGSSDGDGDPLTFQWSLLSAPAGSAAALSNPTIANPTFTVDAAGTYTFQLVVSDGQVSSAPDTVTISTVNSPPVADAGPDQSVAVGTLVTLDGGGSFDVDGDVLTYAWTFTSKPAGSGATLSDPTTAQPTFAVDVAGTYTLALVVSDGTVSSAADTVAISTVNSAPVANAGPNQSVTIGTTATLDGSGSSDVDGDPLSYTWSLISKPSTSSATLANPMSVTPSFVVDVAGSYTVQLVVSDGSLTGTATVLVVGIDPQMALAEVIQTIINTINGLPPSAFQNASMARALTNKLDAVRQKVESGDYAGALNQVENDLLKKTDGCANSGAADANDFITDCAAQGQVYPDLIDLRDQLRALVNP